MKKIKFILSTLLVFLLASCVVTNPSTSSSSSSTSSSSSSSTSSTSSSSSSSSSSSNSSSSSSSEVVDTFEDYGMPVIVVILDDYDVRRDGIYNTKEEVALYIYLYLALPSNYKTKAEFIKKDYTSENKLSTGGDRFYNKERLLPEAAGRIYTEADIEYAGGGRNAKRLVFSNDLLIFYTSDHYASFSIIRIIE